jgi:VWFA-related protein
MLLNFIDEEMSSRDQVAIASASGQIDFLQQFTNNEDVLRAAVSRLKPKPYVVNGYGTGKAPMTEYVALNIDNRSDQKIADFYIEECLKQTDLPRKTASLMRTLRETCNTQVRNGARVILMQAADVTRSTYASLQSLMQSSARRSGRKLAFFVSDGFLLDFGTTASLSDKLMQIISTAQKAGVVVYTIDAKGLVSPGLDATNNVPMDPNARLETLATRAILASQDALHALAVDTGGRALRNTNVFDRVSDPARIPFRADLALKNLEAGYYQTANYSRGSGRKYYCLSEC